MWMRINLLNLKIADKQQQTNKTKTNKTRDFYFTVWQGKLFMYANILLLISLTYFLVCMVIDSIYNCDLNKPFK